MRAKWDARSSEFGLLENLKAGQAPETDFQAFVQAINAEVEKNRAEFPSEADEKPVDDSERLMKLLDQHVSAPRNRSNIAPADDDDSQSEPERRVGQKADSHKRQRKPQRHLSQEAEDAVVKNERERQQRHEAVGEKRGFQAALKKRK